MSSTYQYNYYNRNQQPKIQSQITSNNQSSTISSQSSVQLSRTIETLKQQLRQKQSSLFELSKKLQEQQKILEEKQFIIKQKDLQLEYIHKENQDLHDKIYRLNNRLNEERVQIKDTIKQEVGLLKEQFNFIIKESEIKNQIILQQKQKQFRKKQEEFKTQIKQLSERASSNNGSFYYEQLHSNIIQTKKLPNSSYIYKRHDDFLDNEEDKYSNLKNSRQTYRSSKIENRNLSSLRQSQARQKHQNQLSEKQKHAESTSNLIGLHGYLKEGFAQEVSSQVATGRFGRQQNKKLLNKIPLPRKAEQKKYQFAKTPSKPTIEEIISRSKKELDERNKKLNSNEFSKTHQSSSNLSTKNNLPPSPYKYPYRRAENLDFSKHSGNIPSQNQRLKSQQADQKRRNQKLRQITSLKMKVNMLKTELQQQITFCQHN